MSRNVETITAAEPAHAAINRMVMRRIRHLPSTSITRWSGS